jgi:hypothetical protein
MTPGEIIGPVGTGADLVLLPPPVARTGSRVHPGIQSGEHTTRLPERLAPVLRMVRGVPAAAEIVAAYIAECRAPEAGQHSAGD